MTFTITLLIIAFTALVSIKGFSDTGFRHKLIFNPYIIKNDKEYFRFLTSGFLHADWIHLFVNMYVLYIFGTYLEAIYDNIFEKGGRLLYILMYLSAIVMANISTYFKWKESPTYNALGASGAVSAVLFATILFDPTQKLILLFLPIPMPAVLLGGLYLVYSIIMSRRGGDNINHEAHFYGALYGFLFTGMLRPHLFLSFFEQVKEMF